MSISFESVLAERDAIKDYIMARVKIGRGKDPCWTWKLSLNNYGYGHSVWHRKHIGTHCLSYMAFIGEIPAGLEIDHTCRHRNCCNPKHLEPVTRRVNLLRGKTIPAAHAAKTHCPRGHSLADAYRSNGSRICRLCASEKNAAKYRKFKAAGGTTDEWHGKSRRRAG